MAVLSLDHPLAERDTVEIDDLIDENFLMLPQGSFVSELVLSLCRKAGFGPRVTFTGKRAENIISLVARGAGVSFLMRKPAESLASGKVALVPLEPATTSEVRLYLKRNAAHSQAVVSFIGFLLPSAPAGRPCVFHRGTTVIIPVAPQPQACVRKHADNGTKHKYASGGTSPSEANLVKVRRQTSPPRC